MACIAFELATGDYLFHPHAGKDFSRTDDHLAQMIELLGPIPKEQALSGKFSKYYFDDEGNLKNIPDFKSCSISETLVRKYEWSHESADEFQSFLQPMLDFDPKKRATAAQCLEHPWLKNGSKISK